MGKDENWSIGELASLTEVKAETIRYFEKIGLLSAPHRQANGYRLYLPAHLHQLKFIRRCRKLGFSQQTTRELLAMFGDSAAHTRAEVKAVTAAHLADIREKLRELKTMEQELESLMQHCDGKEISAEECPILNTLANQSGVGIQ